MKNSKKLIFSILLICTISVCGCGHTHTYSEATCTEPQTCTECGETLGEPLGHDMAPATTDAPSTCTRCGYTEGERIPTVNNQSYSLAGITYLNKNYSYQVNAEDGSFAICSWADGSQVDFMHDHLYVYNDAGYIIGVDDGEDGYEDIYVYDSDLNLVYSLSDYNITAFNGIQEDILLLETKGSDGTSHYGFFDFNGNFTLIDQNKVIFISLGFDTVTLITKQFYSEYNGSSFAFDYDTLKDVISNNGDLFDYLEGYVYNDQYVIFNNATANEKGWIYGALTDENFQTFTYGFYNIKTGAFVNTPDDTNSCSYIYSQYHNSRQTAIENYSVQIVGTSEDGDYLYKVFDISKGAYLSDETYLYIGLETNSDLILAKNLDGKWVYLNKKDLSVASDTYEDATDFSKGFALVTINGKEVVIDDEFNTITETNVEANSATLMNNEYYSYFSNDETIYFRIETGDSSYTIITVTP